MERANELPQSQVLYKILKRTAIIFLLGFLMYWFPFVKMDASNHIVLAPFSHTRILGVLQRIALAYGIASLLIYYLKPRAALIVVIAILLLYWAVMFLFGDSSDPLGMTSNAGYKIDKWLMGENHMYHGEGGLLIRGMAEYLTSSRQCGGRLPGWKFYTEKRENL